MRTDERSTEAERAAQDVILRRPAVKQPAPDPRIVEREEQRVIDRWVQVATRALLVGLVAVGALGAAGAGAVEAQQTINVRICPSYGCSSGGSGRYDPEAKWRREHAHLTADRLKRTADALTATGVFTLSDRKAVYAAAGSVYLEITGGTTDARVWSAVMETKIAEYGHIAPARALWIRNRIVFHQTHGR